MSWILDIIVIGIILLCIIMGYKKGLIGVAFSIVSFVGAIIIALILFIPISNFIIDNTTFDETIKNAIVQNFTSDKEYMEEKPQDKRNLPDVMIKSVEKYALETKDASIQAIANELSISSIKFLSFIGIFIVSKIILMFFKVLADAIANLPILKQFNKIGGTIFGILQGFLIVYILLGITTLLAPMLGNAPIYTAIRDSIITNILYDHNILLKLIFW